MPAPSRPRPREVSASVLAFAAARARLHQRATPVLLLPPAPAARLPRTVQRQRLLAVAIVVTWVLAVAMGSR